ncbi:MAG: hypothetical protein AAF846_05435 [Chloroflexota bacterium]
MSAEVIKFLTSATIILMFFMMASMALYHGVYAWKAKGRELVRREYKLYFTGKPDRTRELQQKVVGTIFIAVAVFFYSVTANIILHIIGY